MAKSVNQQRADVVTEHRLPATVTYVVEYDENSVAWLIDIHTNARRCLEHGLLLRIVDEVG